MAPRRLSGGARPLPAACLLVLGVLLWQGSADGAVPRGFVARDGAGFVLDGAPFHVVGTNQCVRRGSARGGTCLAALRGPQLRCAALRPRAHALRPLCRAGLGTSMLPAGLASRAVRGRVLACGRLPPRSHACRK